MLPSALRLPLRLSSGPALLRACLILALTLLLPQLAQAQSFNIPANVIGSGGGDLTGTTYSLSGTVGQSAVGSVTGGSYQLDGGYWPQVQVLATTPAATHIIDKSGGGDFTNFAAAVASLAGGISERIVFIVKDGGDGIYNEQVTIGAITGTSAANTITFLPDGANTNDITLVFDATDASDNWIVKLDGSHYITFDSFIFQPLDANFSRAIHLVGDADYITLSNNTFNGSTAAVDDLQQTHIYAEGLSGDVPDSTIISGNAFIDNSYGVYMVGIPGTEAGFTEIVGNDFEDQFAQALYLNYYDAPVIGWNSIVSLTGAASFEAITLENSIDDMEIVENIINTGGALGLHILSSSGSFGTEGRIVNNVIRVGGAAASVGITIDGGDYWHIYHNTVEITGASASAGRAFYLKGTTDGRLDFRNNIFANTGGGYAYYVNGAPGALITNSDHNLLYTTGLNLAYWDGAALKTLADLQGVTFKDLNSISANPLFIYPDTLNYHLRDDSPAIGLGDLDSDLLTAVGNSDIDGNARPSSGSANPDAGAYENALGTPSTDPPPATPTTLVAMAGNGQVSLTWDPNSEADLKEYWVYQGTATGFDTTGTRVGVVAQPTTTFTALNLTNGKPYYFRVVAVDNAGNVSALSKEVTATPQGAGTAPTVATGVPMRITSTAARLRGVVNPQGLSTDVSFEWGTGWGTGTADTNVVVAAQNLVGAADTTVGARLSDLTPGATYHYRVVATYSTGATLGNDISFVTPTDITVIVDNRVVTGDAAVTFPGASVVLDFTFIGTPGTNTIEVKKFRAAPDGVLPADLALFANRYWEFNHTGPGTFTVVITFNLGMAGVNIGTLAGDFRLLRRESGGTGTWASIVDEALAFTDSTVSFAGIAGFSQFTVARFVDIRPPAIKNIAVLPTGAVESNTALEVTADVTDNQGVDKVTLHVAKGGDNDYALPIAMTDDGSGTYSATIPAAAVTFRGLIYVIRARDAATNADTSEVQFIPVTFASGDLSITSRSTSAYPLGFPKDAWRLLSVPAVLDAPAITDAIGDVLSEQTAETWRIFRYANGNYVENPGNFIPGVAYWLYQRVEDNVEFDVGTGETHDLQAATITVGPLQWQLIGNPYPFIVSVTANQNIFGPLVYLGDGGSEGWDPVTQLLPWGGYAVFNKTDSPLQVRLEATPLAKALGKTVPDPLAVSGWTLQLGAVGQTYRDGANAIGRRAGAAEQLDIYDDPEPPYIDGYISLAMERPEWGANLPRWTSDIRSLQESDGVWDLALYTKGESGPIRLSANLQGDFPPGSRIVLLDVITRQVVDLFPGSEPLVITGYREEFPYHLKVVAGSASYVESTTEDILAQLPDAFALKQNYPNPFNPTTHLEYTVYRPARVSLKIYNILGQELVTLADGWKDLGHYTVAWNGRDRFGRQLASGIYFAIYTAEGRRMARKMVMMK